VKNSHDGLLEKNFPFQVRYLSQILIKKDTRVKKVAGDIDNIPNSKRITPPSFTFDLKKVTKGKELRELIILKKSKKIIPLSSYLVRSKLEFQHLLLTLAPCFHIFYIGKLVLSLS
jgi:hypothetical protein